MDSRGTGRTLANSGVLHGYDHLDEDGGSASNTLDDFASYGGSQILCMNVLVSNGIGSGDIAVGGTSPSSVKLAINTMVSSIRCEDNPCGFGGGDNPDTQSEIKIFAGLATAAVRDLKMPE